MSRLLYSLCAVLFCLILLGFTYEEEVKETDYSFDIYELYDYQKGYKSEEMELCSSNATKTYMDYRSITARNSKQYRFIQSELTVDEKTGFLYDKDGFIGVALGSYFGGIGDRFYFTLENGVVLPVVKCDEKADVHTDPSNCYHSIDGSVIEFVIDKDYALNYYGRLSNDYVLNGNYNNTEMFRGGIVKIEKVLNEENEDYLNFSKNITSKYPNDIFEYASGY